MRTSTWVTPNKMFMDTGHRTFDRQTNIVSTGNIIAATQLAYFVRGELELRCWGPEVYEPGHLRNYDLGNWPQMPSHVRKTIIRATQGTKESVWVSEFFHYRGERKVIHGYVVTTHGHKLLHSFVTGPTYKSSLVIEGVIPYVVEDAHETQLM